MTDRGVVTAAVAVAVAAWLAPPVPWPLAVAGVVVAVASRRPPLLLVALALLVASRAHGQLEALAAPLPSRIDGVAELVEDPRQQLFDWSVVVRVDGRRLQARVPMEDAGMLRTAGTGDRFRVSGRTSDLRGAPEGWVRSRHLAGGLRVERIERGPPTAPWFAAANLVRRTYTAGAASFGDDLRPLYLGMVIGDDRSLSELRTFRFRVAGLAHLSAVSGQNVAFLLAVAAPVLSRVGLRARAALTVALIVVMVMVTRADPSVLRAATMASLGVLAVTTGRTAPALRILGLTVTALVLVDPMLVHALGFRLSVAATLGLVVLSGPIEHRLPGPRWLRLPLAVTLAAQLATTPLLVGLGGGVSPVSVVANLLAVPAAGMVMMSGVVLGAVAGLVVEPVAELLQWPNRLLVGWVDLVARIASTAPIAPFGPLRSSVTVGAVVVAAAVRGSWCDTWRPAVRRGVAVLAVLVALACCWPSSLSTGRHRLVDGVELVRGGCGGSVVLLSDGAGPTQALEAFHAVSLRRIDLLVVEAGRGPRAGAAVVQEQWPVRRRIDLDDGVSERVRVGGVEVVVRGQDVTIETSEAACRLAP
jgi:competence protein ComEC